MGLRDHLERALGLGTADEPRALSVEGPPRRASRPVVSTPGARVRLSRDGWDGELARGLLMCHRRGVPVELVDGANGLWLDGVETTPLALRAALGGAALRGAELRGAALGVAAIPAAPRGAPPAAPKP